MLGKINLIYYSNLPAAGLGVTDAFSSLFSYPFSGDQSTGVATSGSSSIS